MSLFRPPSSPSLTFRSRQIEIQCLEMDFHDFHIKSLRDHCCSKLFNWTIQLLMLPKSFRLLPRSAVVNGVLSSPRECHCFMCDFSSMSRA